MTFVDTHCHLDDAKLKDNLDSIVAKFRAANVGIVVNIGCDAITSEIVKSQAESLDGVYFAAGIHPMDVGNATDKDLDKIAELAKHPKCVAIGEIGLDYYWDKTFKDKQKEFFGAQIRLAKAVGLPVNIHVRDAMGDAVEILKSNKENLTYGGVMHCYSGSKETAKELIKLGLYISFGGTLTFKNAKNAVEVAAAVPIDRILTETDSPYLAPEPVRGTVNSPANIPYIAARLASVRGVDISEIERAVYNNTLTLFKKIRA
nr:TatD family hydrolase [Clostridia bacterium]